MKREDRRKALILEGSSELAEMLGDLLELDGYAITVAADRAAAERLLRSGYVPDVVFLDLLTSEAEGRALLAVLRELGEPCSSAPVIAYTEDETQHLEGVTRTLSLRRHPADELLHTLEQVCPP